MKHWKNITAFLALVIVFLCITGARWSLYQPPHRYELISGETWALQVYTSSTTLIFELNSSGVLTTDYIIVNNDLAVTGRSLSETVTKTGVSVFDCTSGGSEYQLTTDYWIYLIDLDFFDADSGCTLPLPSDLSSGGTGYEIVFKQIGSYAGHNGGITPFILNAGLGDTIESGLTLVSKVELSGVSTYRLVWHGNIWYELENR